jgi:hypothetical protein
VARKIWQPFAESTNLLLAISRENGTRAGLPDGIFSNKKSRSEIILHGLAMEDAGLFYGHSAYFMVIWYIFHHFGILYQAKSGNPELEAEMKKKPAALEFSLKILEQTFFKK